MAYLFELAAELGSSRDGIQDLTRTFDGVTWVLSDKTEINCDFKLTSSSLWIGPDGQWWCRFVPNGASATGSGRKINSDQMLIELTRKMYETLRTCSGFRFALIGWEVAESVVIDDLLGNERAIEFPPGLVVSKDLWLKMGKPDQLVPFGFRSFWKPL